MISLTCPQCQERFDVPDSLAGRQEACPACEYLLAVPGVQPPPAETEPVGYARPTLPSAKRGDLTAALAGIPDPPKSAAELSAFAALLVIVGILALIGGIGAAGDGGAVGLFLVGLGSCLSCFVAAAALRALAQIVRYVYLILLRLGAPSPPVRSPTDRAAQ